MLLISPDFPVRKYAGSHIFRRFSTSRSKLRGNLAFPETSHIKKLGETTVCYVVRMKHHSNCKCRAKAVANEILKKNLFV